MSRPRSQPQASGLFRAINLVDNFLIRDARYDVPQLLEQEHLY